MTVFVKNQKGIQISYTEENIKDFKMENVFLTYMCPNDSSSVAWF